jgi:hypothetical protein
VNYKQKRRVKSPTSRPKPRSRAGARGKKGKIDDYDMTEIQLSEMIEKNEQSELVIDVLSLCILILVNGSNKYEQILLK